MIDALAPTAKTLLGRGYAAKDGKRLLATDLGCWAVDVIYSIIPQATSPEMTNRKLWIIEVFYL